MEQLAKKQDNTNNLLIIEEFCEDCVSDIPIRARHCEICRNCVATFDHHCNFVGNCIGERNKGLFIIFVLNHNLELIFSILVV